MLLVRCGLMLDLVYLYCPHERERGIYTEKGQGASTTCAGCEGSSAEVEEASGS